MSDPIVVIPAGDLKALIVDAVRTVLTAEPAKKPTSRGRELLTAALVRAEYRIGRDQLLAYGDSGRLPFHPRKGRGGTTVRLYRREDCDRVLADTTGHF